jgi:hypothetical protein
MVRPCTIWAMAPDHSASSMRKSSRRVVVRSKLMKTTWRCGGVRMPACSPAP